MNEKLRVAAERESALVFFENGEVTVNKLFERGYLAREDEVRELHQELADLQLALQSFHRAVINYAGGEDAWEIERDGRKIYDAAVKLRDEPDEVST